MAWNISSAVLLQSATTIRTNYCIFFKPDGSKMYSVTLGSQFVQEYDLSTPWDISTISYLQELNVTAEIDSGQGIFFKPDGLKMYILDTFFAFYEFHEYDLSVAWDVTSAAFLQSSPTKLGYYRSGLFFKPDGLKVYFFNTETTTGVASIFEYDLSVAWDVTSAAFLQTYVIASGVGGVYPSSVFFKPDGKKMYTVIYISGVSLKTHEYNLSTPWDISTAVDYSNIEVSHLMLAFNDDGSKLYSAEHNGQAIDEYDLAAILDTPFPLSIELFESKEYSIITATANEYGVAGSNSPEYSIEVSEQAGG